MIEQTDYDRIVDMIRWRNLGRLPRQREALSPESLLCTAPHFGGQVACSLWGIFMYGGRRYCRIHAPKGAVRR